MVCEAAMAARLELSLPAVLRLQLLADMDAVAREGRSVPLPRRPCVREVLARYVELRTPRSKTKADASVAEVAEGLLRYFDEALPRVLLYAEEKFLHAQWMVSGTKPSEVYGAEHFLRLFVRLPDLLPYHRLDPASQDLLQERLQDVLHYLSKHRAKYFAVASSSRPPAWDPSPSDLHRTDLASNPDVVPTVSVLVGGATRAEGESSLSHSPPLDRPSGPSPSTEVHGGVGQTDTLGKGLGKGL